MPPERVFIPLFVARFSLFPHPPILSLPAVHTVTSRAAAHLVFGSTVYRQAKRAAKKCEHDNKNFLRLAGRCHRHYSRGAGAEEKLDNNRNAKNA